MIPVYNLIKSSLPENLTDLTDIEKQALVSAITNINKNGSELIYSIIRSYENDVGSDNTIPFNGRIQKSGIRFEIDTFDIKLKHILQKFIDIHNANIN
jgi:hypothetical protein